MSCERLTTRLAILDTFKHVPASFRWTASQNISWEQNVTSCSYRERTLVNTILFVYSSSKLLLQFLYICNS